MKEDPKANVVPWRHRRKAFVVAGDSQARRHLGEALSRMGFRAEVSADLRSIPRHREGGGPSLLILEKGEAGLDVVRQLRRKGADTPVIFLSGGPAAEKSFDPDVTFAEHLRTPYTLETLGRAILKATERQG